MLYDNLHFERQKAIEQTLIARICSCFGLSECCPSQAQYARYDFTYTYNDVSGSAVELKARTFESNKYRTELIEVDKLHHLAVLSGRKRLYISHYTDDFIRIFDVNKVLNSKPPLRLIVAPTKSGDSAVRYVQKEFYEVSHTLGYTAKLCPEQEII